MMRRNTIKKAGATFAQLALSVTALTGGANSYYRTQRGFYSPGKQMITELDAKPLSATAIQNGEWEKSPEPAASKKTDRLELKKTQQTRELIIVDSAVEDKNVIFKQGKPGVDIVEMESGKDSMVELMKILSNYSSLDAVHIISHAEAGAIHMGGQKIDQKELEEDLAAFAAINNAIREGGDLMLYGCNVAKGDEGNEFLEIIKNNTHVDIAASSDLTGNGAYGGNWELEIRKGDINATPLPESIAMIDFTGTLQPSGTKTFESWNGEFYSDDPTKDWDDFTTYILTPGTYSELISGITCGDDLYVSMYDSNSQFLIRSNPAGEYFGVTGLNISTPDNGGSPATEVAIFGYEQDNSTPVGTKNNVNVESDTGTDIDLTTGISGSFANIMRLRIQPDNDDFCLSSVTFSSLAPTVTTTAETGVGTTSATLGGNVTDDGGDTVSDRGIVWATSSGPDINDNKVAIGTGTGSFSQSVDLLPFGTTIFVRAYATNSEGTAYGTEESFVTGSTVSVSLTGDEGWRMLSVPDNVALSTFLDPIWTQGATSGGDTNAGTPNVYTWSTSVDGNNQADWQEVTDLINTTLDGGYGFLVQVFADDDLDGTPEGFPKILSVTGSEYATGVSPTMNSNATGWTVLGNPFGSAIDYDELPKTSLASTIYVWNPNDNDGDANGDTEPSQSTGSWNTWNGSVGDVEGGRIAPFQGFLVQNTSTGSNVTFTQTSKTSTSATILGKESPIPFVRLELEGNGMSNSAWLEFVSNGSTDKTDGDAWELTPLSSNYALLATRKDDGSLVDIGRYPQSSELEIPLVTEATQAGTFTLRVTDFEATGQTLYLNDFLAGKSIRLEKGTRYEFTMERATKAPADPFVRLQGRLKKETSDTHRFVISSSAIERRVDETPDQFALEQNYPNPFNPVTVINYQLPVNSDVRLEVFDMAGRQITTLVSGQQQAGTHSVNFDGSALSSGVYMYRLQVVHSASFNGTGNQVFTRKLTLIK